MGLPVAHFEILAWLRDKARDRHVLAEDVLKLIAEESASKETKLAAQREALKRCLQKKTATWQRRRNTRRWREGICLRLASARRRQVIHFGTVGLTSWPCLNGHYQ